MTVHTNCVKSFWVWRAMWVRALSWSSATPAVSRPCRWIWIANLSFLSEKKKINLTLGGINNANLHLKLLLSQECARSEMWPEVSWVQEVALLPNFYSHLFIGWSTLRTLFLAPPSNNQSNYFFKKDSIVEKFHWEITKNNTIEITLKNSWLSRCY